MLRPTLLDGKNPFAPDPVLKNIMTGVDAEESVDVDEARAKGEKILSSMAGAVSCNILVQAKIAVCYTCNKVINKYRRRQSTRKSTTFISTAGIRLQ